MLTTGQRKILILLGLGTAIYLLAKEYQKNKELEASANKKVPDGTSPQVPGQTPVVPTNPVNNIVVGDHVGQPAGSFSGYSQDGKQILPGDVGFQKASIDQFYSN